ncbi:MAG: hypothetical protein Q8K97_17540 [Pseudohongiella sp.]|nr:hypothetical protein [Pseudohongiella sp.]
MSNAKFEVIGFDILTDIMVAVYAWGKAAADEEFSSHVPAVNPYETGTVESDVWLRGYREKSDEIMLEMSRPHPLSEEEWVFLAFEASEGCTVVTSSLST